MFVIFGANGNTGRVAAETLLRDGRAVRVVLRDPAKGGDAWRRAGAEVVQGDLAARESLAAAFAGASGVYLLVPPDATTEDANARAERLIGEAAAALAAAHVPHVVLLSSVGAEHADGTGPIVAVHRAEQILGAVPGLACTFLRASYFLENHLGVLPVAKEHGVLPTFLPADLKLSQVATSDIGRQAARALVEPPDAAATRVWNLAGPEDVSERDVAAALGALIGRPIAVVEKPLAEVVPTLASFGVSSHMAGLYAEMYAAIASGRVAFAPNADVIRGKDGAREVFARALG